MPNIVAHSLTQMCVRCHSSQLSELLLQPGHSTTNSALSTLAATLSCRSFSSLQHDDHHVAGPRVRVTPSCVLCPVVGPPLRRTSCGRFCHVGCAQWLEETFIQHGVVHGLRNVSKVRHIPVTAPVSAPFHCRMSPAVTTGCLPVQPSCRMPIRKI